MKTYLDLVNDAIVESGIDLDKISTDNSTPVDWDDTAGRHMYDRFKKWVSDAWKEIQMERNEWEFQKGHWTGTIYPRMLVEDGNRLGGEPPVGAEFVGQKSGYRYFVRRVITLEGEWAEGSAKAIIEFEDSSGARDAEFNEWFTELAPTPTQDVYRYTYWARYNFYADIPRLSEIDPRSFLIQGTNANGLNMPFVHWAAWQRSYEASNRERGQPAHVTFSPDGLVDFYPRPEKPYTVTFTYQVAPETLTEPEDIPAIDPQYQDFIFWRAVLYYANWDKNTEVERYAKTRHNFYKNRMERNLMPKVDFQGSRYNV